MTLLLSHCLLHCLTHHICSVFRWDIESNENDELRDEGNLLLQGAKKVERVKVYLCGYPEAGKTTLVHTLKGNEAAAQQQCETGSVAHVKQRTRGIEMSTVRLCMHGMHLLLSHSKSCMCET